MRGHNAMRISPRNALGAIVIAAAAIFAGCDSGGSSSPPFSSGTGVPTPTPVPGATNTPTPVPTNTPTPTPPPTSTPTPSPTPSPAPAPIGGSAAQLNFTVVGNSQQFTVTENGYAGPLTASNGTPSCAGIATFSPAAGTGPSATFTVTAVGAGTCAIVVTDNHGGSVGVNVTVTTTTGSISGTRRKTQ
jgi:hypothetical protein